MMRQYFEFAFGKVGDLNTFLLFLQRRFIISLSLEKSVFSFENLSFFLLIFQRLSNEIPNAQLLAQLLK